MRKIISASSSKVCCQSAEVCSSAPCWWFCGGVLLDRTWGPTEQLHAFCVTVPFGLFHLIMFEQLNWRCSQPIKLAGTIILANQRPRKHPLWRGPVWDVFLCCDRNKHVVYSHLLKAPSGIWHTADKWHKLSSHTIRFCCVNSSWHPSETKPWLIITHFSVFLCRVPSLYDFIYLSLYGERTAVGSWSC